MTNKPLISVVIPAFNSAETIEEVLRSLACQESQNFEVLIVDDYSDDYEELSNKVRKFSTIPISLTRLPKHKNGAAARNHGIKLAIGKYIAFCDADDYWDPKKTKRLQEIFQNIHEPTLVYHQVICKKQTGTTFLFPKRGIGNNEAITDYLFAENGLIQTSSIALPRSCAIDGVLFNENLNRHQDWDFVLQANRSEIPIRYIAEPLSTWNIRTSLGKSKRESWRWSINWMNENLDCFTQRSKIFFLTQVVLPKQLVERAWSNALTTTRTALRLDTLIFLEAITKYLRRTAKKWYA